MPAFEAEHPIKHFGALSAVRDVSIEVKPGDIVGFLMPTGA